MCRVNQKGGGILKIRACPMWSQGMLKLGTPGFEPMKPIGHNSKIEEKVTLELSVKSPCLHPVRA